MRAWLVAAAALALAGCAPYQAPKLTAAEVHARMAKGEAVLFVDVRSPKAYALEHIDGAVNRPVSRLGAEGPNLPRDRWVVLYCT
jgi:rhodanese-related sulfurtransferase